MLRSDADSKRSLISRKTKEKGFRMSGNARAHPMEIGFYGCFYFPKRGIDVYNLFGRSKGGEGGLFLEGKGFRFMSDDFLYRDVPAFGRKVFRLGLATNYGADGEDLEWIWCSQAPRTVSSSKRTYITFGRRVPCQRKKWIG